jgi:hypothetical protein
MAGGPPLNVSACKTQSNKDSKLVGSVSCVDRGILYSLTNTWGKLELLGMFQRRPVICYMLSPLVTLCVGLGVIVNVHLGTRSMGVK